MLDENTLLLEYELGEQKSFVWAVTPDSVKSFELPGRATIEQEAKRFYQILTEQWSECSKRNAGTAKATIGSGAVGLSASSGEPESNVVTADGG